MDGLVGFGVVVLVDVLVCRVEVCAQPPVLRRQTFVSETRLLNVCLWADRNGCPGSGATGPKRSIIYLTKITRVATVILMSQRCLQLLLHTFATN